MPAPGGRRLRGGPGARRGGAAVRPHRSAAVAQQDTLDGMLADALPADWPLARIDPVLRALLRAGELRSSR